jgi:hypothetical protein
VVTITTFFLQPDFSDERLVLNHAFSWKTCPCQSCCGRGVMKDQVLGASSLFGWQHSCDFVSECLEVKRHSCGASSAQTQLAALAPSRLYSLQSFLASGTEAHDGYSSRAKWVSVMQHAERLVSAAQSKGNQVCTNATCVFAEAVREKDSIKEIARLGSPSHEIAATDPSQ